MRSDGRIKTGKTARLERSFAQYYFRYMDGSRVFKIKAKSPDGRTVYVAVNGIKNSDRTANRAINPVNREAILAQNALDGPQRNAYLHIIDDSTARLRIRMFTGKYFPEEIDSLFETIEGKNIKRIVLDLRGNSGGLDHFSSHLISKFTDKPFRYMGNHTHKGARTVIRHVEK